MLDDRRRGRTLVRLYKKSKLDSSSCSVSLLTARRLLHYQGHRRDVNTKDKPSSVRGKVELR